MVTSLNWIKALVPGLTCTDQEYFDKMTMSGTKVEGWKNLDNNLEKIVVGRVESIAKHPNADHLLVCRVNIGDRTVQICTSAQNLKVGDLVPTCLDGGKVAGGHDGGPMPEKGIKIKAGKMRDVESDGMMCGIEELGGDRNKYPEAPENGIYVFPEDSGVKPGDDAVEALGMHDTVFDYEITNNRVDCYSMIGIAREAAATFHKKLEVPEPVVKEDPSVKTADLISVSIEAPDLCCRYIARACTNVKIGPSPLWLRDRLRNSGIRPINNLVDITNYVMLEYGQPMHAYDYDTLHGHKIVVKRAADGDTFTTLDEQERKLDHDVLMIYDAERPVGIAGIMGGADSMITDSVHTVLFEAATFDGTNIRKSAKRIGLQTDASGIFSKGLDPRNAELAINRACELMNALGCGTPATGMVDVKAQPLTPLRRIKFEPAKINAYLGTSYTDAEMKQVFADEELGFDENTQEVVVPSWRQDLKQMCDLSEECARFLGYDNVPSTLPESSATRGGLSPKLELEEMARDTAERYGFNEAQTFSFESPKVFDKLKFAPDAVERKAIVISNPLGEDFSVMRTTPLNGLLTSLATNYNRRNPDVRLYEIANVYLSDVLPITDYPEERTELSFGFYGDGDFYTLKGLVEDLFETLGLTGIRAKENKAVNELAKESARAGRPIGGDARNRVILDPDCAPQPFLHPGRQASVLYNGTCFGYIGEVHPDVLKNYDIGDRAYVGVIHLKNLLPYVHMAPHFEGIAKFPAVTRDISMVVPKEITAGQIESVIINRGGKILESYRLFDIYEGAQILAGHKSMAYTLTFRNKVKTLEEPEITKAMDKILEGLKELGIELRA